ncbi:DUF6179 domain-containing protein [Lacrimispora defluvii]|uniref:Uncharacterized protein n=1 Tax=Lacrimispora defluvii TaxID=2719233 RepID=A0ABX1VS37_9FIRM|nr:DUF6179 domain-containing protein [Lacrimispora defluvii]NNJ31255.1 hypothetical protein [Lacrimispora defluvii]
MPVVAMLAARYTSNESTSVSYDKARQLMGAVIYCIEEYENTAAGLRDLVTAHSTVSADTAYRQGYEILIEKVKKIQQEYNLMMKEFQFYGNRCCYDTFQKGMPEFFLYYDTRFHPMNHILTLDYPVLVSLEPRCGADLMEVYVRSASLEQSFLQKLPADYIMHVLNAYSGDYGELIINLASIVIRNVLGCRIAGKSIDLNGYSPVEMERLKLFIRGKSREELEEQLKKYIDELMDFAYEGNEELGNYLKEDVRNFSFELQHGLNYNCFQAMLAVGNN